VGRVVLAIVCLVAGLAAAYAFSQAVADDPCENRGPGDYLLVVGALLFGVAAYLFASRATTRRWVPAAIALATAVVGYAALVGLGLVFFWIEACTN
jgi:hypothetical protein